MTVDKNTCCILLFFLGCFILPCNTAIAGEKQSQESWKKICEQVAGLPFPDKDRPNREDLKGLAECNPYDLYYGFEESADPQKARLCAYYEMDRPKVASAIDKGPFDGKTILMTIYANGVGAKRNFDLALKLACKIDGAPAEIEGRVRHLAKLKAQNWQGNNFSLCDDATSGYLAGFCADHENRFASIKRSERLDVVQSKWTSVEMKEYSVLKKIADQYFDIHAEKEVCQSGTARAALSIADTSGQEEKFIKTMELLEKGKLPKSSAKELADADSRLNGVYRQVQRKPDFEWGTVTKEGIRDTQRAWIKYRDAWAKFCERKYPGFTESIKTYLTLQRIKELEDFLD